ncbi:MAG TPA: choice-of-anchor J domain-containing protein [Bacteroidales bacterium]|nr:choice-of-anchor J domain-containing protein [Bacteroidales bacterium]HSA44814.1 choice-of-anchor J domain-containing protein [Bacteroidales bacterium]
MKRIVLLAAMSAICLTAFAQYYLDPAILAGTNPGGLNTDDEYPFGGGLAADWTNILGPLLATPAWSPVQSLPFAFDFNGSPVTSYKVSSSGVLTFNTGTALAAPPYVNSVLPDAQIPDNSLCIWGLAGTGSNDYIVTKTFGTAPNRQHWVFFTSYSGEVGGSGWQYWSIVMEESTNKIYFVDQRFYGNPVSLTIGIQINNTTVFQVPGSPSVASYSTNLPTPEDNSYYAFIPGIQDQYDAAVISQGLPPVLPIASAPFTISGELFNFGSETLTTLQLHYSIDGGMSVDQAVSGISITPFGTWSFSHFVPWNPAQAGTYTVRIWASDLNGNPDQNTVNDTLTVNVMVSAASVPRKLLHEDFTSSTCSPCAFANTNLATIFANNPGAFTCVKYPMAWPGAGDPYYTTEGNNRRNLYGVAYVPYLTVDGNPGMNGGSYNQTLFDTYAAVPAFVGLSATYQISGQSVSVQSIIDPLMNFTSPDIRLFVAVIEYETNNNVGGSGETSFHYIMKKMLPDAGGTTLGNLTTGMPLNMNFNYTFQGNYRLPSGSGDPINHAIEHSVEQFSDLGVVIWLQDVTSHEVLQSCFAVLTQGTLVDVGTDALLSPLSGPYAGSNVPVTVKVKNYGASPVSDIPVSCIVDGSLLAADTIHTTLDPGDFVDFTFPVSVDLSAGGSFTITAFTALPADTITVNDTLTETVVVYMALDSLYESFEDNYPPQYWSEYNPLGGDGWEQQTVGTTPIPGWNGGVVTPAPSGSGGDKMAFCTWNTSGSSTCDQWLITPGVLIGNYYSLSCYIRKFGDYADTLDVLIITGGAGPEFFTILLESIGWGASDTGWIYRNWDFSAYAGQLVMIAFREHVLDNNNDGAAVFLDQVRLGPILQYDLAVSSHNFPATLGMNNAPFTVSGNLMNHGSQVINSLQLHYQVDGGSVVTENLNGLNIPPMTSYSFSFATPWNPPAAGQYTMKLWASFPNGHPDENAGNDTLTASLTIVSMYIQRKPLLEDFTSSTCSPCATGDQVLDAILDFNPGEFTCIKYPMYWPGLGDPYYTAEGENRMNYYGADYVPELFPDGGPGMNTGTYTQGQFDANMAVPCFVDLMANCTITGQSVEVHTEIIPYGDYNSSDLVLHVGIFEYETQNNIGGSGATSFSYIMKKMLPDASGSPMPALVNGITQSLDLSYIFQGDYRLPINATVPIDHNTEHSVEQFTDLGAAVWLQNAVTKEVLQSCFANVTVVPLLDVAARALISPLSGLAQPAAPVTIRVKNPGTITVSNIPVGCYVNGSLHATGLIPDTLDPGELVNFTFPQTIDLSVAGDYTFMVYTALPGDQVTGNNVLTSVISIQGALDSINESFEDDFPPLWWQEHNPLGGNGWYQETVGNAPIPGWTGGVVTPTPSGNGGNHMAFCTYNTSGQVACDQWLITPQVNISNFYELSCWFRKFGSYSDTLDVLISTTGADPEDFNILVEQIGWGVSDTGWIYKSWDLAAYAGQTIMIAFREHVLDNLNDGAAIFLDQVRVGYSVLPIVISFDEGSHCPGNIHLPLMAANMQDVASISLSFTYDPAHLQYQSYQQVHPALGSGALVIYEAMNRVNLAWYSLTPVSLAEDTLVVFNFSGGVGSSQLTWDLTTPGACYITDFGAQPLPAAFINATVTVAACNNLAGLLRYFNNNLTPITNTPLQLLQNGDVTGNTTTGQSGYYIFSGLTPGSGFNLDVQCSKTWGGGNAVDALKAMQHFVNMLPLTGLKLAAADVDGSGFVNAVDALTIMKRFVGVQSSFVTGDWIFEDPAITVSTDDTTFQNIHGLCYGDIDGSYTPPLKEAPLVELAVNGQLVYEPGIPCILPLRTGEMATPASLSLVLQVPAGTEILDVRAAVDGICVFKQVADELRIAWISLEPRKLNAGDELFLLTVRQFTGGGPFVVRAGSLAGDLEGNPVIPFLILMPELVPASPGIWLGEPYPVPFNDKLLLPIRLEEAASVCIRLINPLGRASVLEVKTSFPAGSHELLLNTAGLPPSFYLMEVEVITGESVEHQVRKVVCVR